MKLSVTTSELVEGLRRVLNVVSSHSTMPVLSNVLLRAEGDALLLSTTDLQVSITTRVAAEVEEEGKTTLRARKFSQVVSAFTGEKVTLNTDENLVTAITCGKANFRLSGLDANEFPLEGEVDEQRRLTFAKEELGKTLSKIAYAVSTDQTRYVLNGILLSVHEGDFTAVATDGRRLALVERPFEEGEARADGEVILPIKVVNELGRLLTGEGEVTVRISDAQASFATEQTTITSKLIEGSYPNYRQVIPSSFESSVALPRERFEEVLKRVAVVADDEATAIKFVLSENQLLLSALSAEVGEAEEPLEIDYQGDEVTFSFNPDYLIDPLRNLECDEITLRFNDEFKPIVIVGDEGFLCVIMPMRN